jgi:glycosyltransferase involved in cell wall biosynthesis
MSSYVLWLPSWYPNKLDPFDGDFIQRHAQAVSAYKPIHVCFVVKDENKQVTDSIKVEDKKEGNLRETIIYYAGKRHLFGFYDRIHSFRKYQKLFRQQLQLIFKQNGLPELVHVHIAFKAGLIATWIKKEYHVPYVLTEQWTLYLDEAKPNLEDVSRVNRFIISKTVGEASLLLPVSNYLGEAMRKRWPSIPQEVVPNVVNTNIFSYRDTGSSSSLQLVHISTLSYQKDPDSLFNAVLLLKKQGLDFVLHVFGPAREWITTFIKENDLSDQIILYGEVSQAHLAGHIQKCDALILYSRYETFGCVLIEANACGKPVIVPDTALMREIVIDNSNGILVKPGSYIALAEAITQFGKNRDKFNALQIATSTVEKYSYSTVGKQYAEIYSRLTGG